MKRPATETVRVRETERTEKERNRVERDGNMVRWSRSARASQLSSLTRSQIYPQEEEG